MKKEERRQSHNSALWKRQGRENQHREKREQGGVPLGWGEVGRDVGEHLHLSELLLCVQCAATLKTAQFGSLSSGTCTLLPQLPSWVFYLYYSSRQGVEEF